MTRGRIIAGVILLAAVVVAPRDGPGARQAAWVRVGPEEHPCGARPDGMLGALVGGRLARQVVVADGIGPALGRSGGGWRIALEKRPAEQKDGVAHR